MSRVRLTARDRSAAGQEPYPGNVNQPDRKDPAMDEYHTFEQRVNHELPDMRHQWQDDSRDDIGFGIPEAWGKSPTVASVRVAANKAVRVAMLLLGDKVSDDLIEAQAQDLMAMGPAAMDRTLQRFADTQKLYAEDAEEKDEEEVEAKKAADEKAEEKKDEKAEEKKAADEKDDKKEPPAFIKEKMDEKKEGKKAADEKKDEKDAKCAADEKKDDEKKEEAKCAADDEKKDEKAEDKKAADESKDEEKAEDKAEEKKASAPRRGTAEMDIELGASMDDEAAPDPEADERLASVLFPDEVTAGTSDRKVEASQKKAGISKLGGQPRVASAGADGIDISSIWQSAPDVSEAFK